MPAPHNTARPLAPDVIHVFTDGACAGNPGPAACAAVLWYNGHIKEIARPLGQATNNIAELSAIREALQRIKRRSIPVKIYTDSAYAYGVLNNPSWKPRENLALIAQIKRLLQQFASVEFVKVPAHAQVPYNLRADQLARSALNQQLHPTPPHSVTRRPHSLLH
ncbi:MAG: ribonuclease HI [bacterium]|nr:ribonuclease HI [bacterium]